MLSKTMYNVRTRDDVKDETQFRMDLQSLITVDNFFIVVEYFRMRCIRSNIQE